MSRLVIMSGPAGSGKSTWAEKYANENENTIIVSSDSIRYELFNKFCVTFREEKVVQSTIKQRVIDAGKKDINVVLDTAAVKNKSILKLHRRYKDFFDSFTLVILDTPLEVCLKQNKMRDRQVPEDVIKEMYSFKEQINKEIVDSFSEILIIKVDNKEEK